MPQRRGGRSSSGGWRGGRGGNDNWRGRGVGNREHGRGNRGGDRVNDQERERPERQADTAEQAHARATYNSWKRFIKNSPRANDVTTITGLWSGALDILNGSDIDKKQQLPRDLDSEEYHGRAHIQTLMGMNVHQGGSRQFLELSQPFLLVITHDTLLNSLTMDTTLGNLYIFISGSNGSRAVAFFQQVCTQLTNDHIDNPARTSAFLEDTLNALVRSLSEVLKREQRSRFNDDLPQLFNSLENILDIAGIDNQSSTFQFVSQKIAEFRAIVARARGLLQDEEEKVQVNGVSSAAVVSTYQMPLIVPQGRHDNDHMNIENIKILPTVGEIRSDHPEFLPSTDRDQPHFLENPALRHLDTHFRLLRHDIFGELKNALAGLVLGIERDATILQKSNLNFGNIRAHPYPNAYIRFATFNERQGLEYQISFPHPLIVRKKSKSERTKWWRDSKRLEEGTLLCLLAGPQNSLLFLVVSSKQTDSKEQYGLTSHDKIATITAKLATRAQEDLETILQLSIQKTPGILIELPGVILATFTPVLESLQEMHRLGRLPFRQWILPERGNTTEVSNILPPLYARAGNFNYSLKSILRDNNTPNVMIHPKASPDDGDLIDKISTCTTLDRGQCQALITALTREFAQIQGPPGTGKSYLGTKIMSVLLDVASQVKLGPIIVVCYTNHALDQFLEHLLAIGIQQIIRIGGSSKSIPLEGKNLRVVTKGEGKTKFENYQCAMAHKAIEEEEIPIKSHLSTLYQICKQKPSWAALKSHLSRYHPKISQQFSRFDEDGFETVGREPFDTWLDNTREANPVETRQTMQQLVAAATRNVHAVMPSDRDRLVELWISEIQEEITDNLYESIKETEKFRQDLSKIYDEVDRRVLETAQVIGVTTSGLAKRMATLQKVKCKVLICEEAGEITEPHFLTALLPSIEHVISIGDHQQLRPKINNHNLSLESQQGAPYQLDRSQFERLSIGEPGRPRFPIAQLNVQRRMRPEISELIRSTIYPRLIDHADVKHLPDVVGLRRNVFWFDHEHTENSQDDLNQKSHANLWEVDMTHALLRHIVRQGKYNSSEIAVLTPYTGQLQKLRAKFRSEFEIVLSERDQDLLVREGFADGEVDEEKVEAVSTKRPLAKKQMSELLRLSTVDNFQGEESKVVIVSLVRSNNNKKVGFLSTTNRINVLLSRAQHGLYLIGNSETYSNVEMWNEVLGMLRAHNSVGTAFSLCCPRHPETEILASSPEDFIRHSPEGGCDLVCNRRLSACGHQCLARCHSETMHEVFSCPKPCERLHTPCDHSCQKATCGEDCGDCKIKIDNVLLPCGHVKNGVQCYQTQQEDLPKIQCDILVDKESPQCKHLVSVPCSVDINSAFFRCPKPCDSVLKCGHLCPATCGRCNTKNEKGEIVQKHSICRRVCDRPLGTCSHRCKSPCHEGKACPPCSLPCEVRCPHSRCSLECAKPCAPCVEKCTWSCEDHSCSLPCGAPCNRLPCDKRCSKLLLCGHQCPSLCQESCPEAYCQECKEKGDARVDLLEMKSYDEIDLNETPIVVLSCGHFFTAETLDGMIGMSTVYELNGNGEYTSLKDISSELASSIPKCPDCRIDIRQFVTQRYNRVINRAVIDEMSKRFLVDGQQRLHECEEWVKKLGKDLDTAKEKILGIFQQGMSSHKAIITDAQKIDVNLLINRNQGLISKLEKNIRQFKASVANKNQPAQKLHDAIIHARRAQSIETQIVNLGIDETPAQTRPDDQRITLGARGVELKAEHVILDHRFSITQVIKKDDSADSIKIPGEPPDQRCSGFLKRCKNFIIDCNAESLPKLAVEATLYFAKSARSLQMYCHALDLDLAKSNQAVAEAKELLGKARVICEQPFQNAEVLEKALGDIEKLLEKEWYEEVTKEEIEAIKTAMVSGPGGIASHSGHWYNCRNGHPFAIGDCGMPMQLARCPECGAPVGGQRHQPVGGVTRATQME